LAQRLGVRFATPESAKIDCDVVFHASGTAAGLDAAIAHAGEEATVLELSWYGEQPVAASLGGSFHSRRLRLISSQVGKIAPSHRPRWTHGQRLRAALNLLADARLDALLAPAVRFRDLPSRLPALLDPKSNVIAQLISYD
jgi:threonine dehydrogenase-like Zn-dependent dehydrogenase